MLVCALKNLAKVVDVLLDENERLKKELNLEQVVTHDLKNKIEEVECGADDLLHENDRFKKERARALKVVDADREIMQAVATMIVPPNPEPIHIETAYEMLNNRLKALAEFEGGGDE
jgi:hypothetical protein